MSEQRKNLLRKIMRAMRYLMPDNGEGENKLAVRMFYLGMRAADFVNGKSVSQINKNPRMAGRWPVAKGAYISGDFKDSIAVCTLTSTELMKPLSKNKGVAIAGRLVTVNLGIEKVILNVISNPNIRYLFVCGKDSPVFHTSQGLKCLFEKGTDTGKRIIDAKGHYPVLRNVSFEQVEAFRKQCNLVDFTDEKNVEVLNSKIDQLNKDTISSFQEDTLQDFSNLQSDEEISFRRLKPGGKQDSLVYDPKGFFVISVDQEAGEIVVLHYFHDNTPAHEMRAKRAESILRGLLRENLISQMGHAGYMGVELGKAETALRLGIPYEQDHPVTINDRS